MPYKMSLKIIIMLKMIEEVKGMLEGGGSCERSA